MSITFINSANGGTGSSTSFSITLPTTAANDIIILEYVHRGTADATLGGTYTGPAFTEKRDQLFATSTFSAKTLWSRATGNHSGQTVTGSGLTNSCAAIVTVYRGCLTSGDPLADATIVGEQNASGNETQAEITTTTAGAWVVLVVANSPDVALSAQTCTSPGTLTGRVEVLSTAGTDTSIGHASAEKAAAGATGAFTWAQTDGASGSWAYALKPQLTGASWLEAVNTQHTVDTSSGNVQLRLRVGIKNTGGAVGASAFEYAYSKNSGAYAPITASSSNIKTVTTAHYADGDDVPQSLTAGNYQTDNNAAEESTGAFTLAAGLTAGYSTETEIALEVIAADVADADTIDIRVRQADDTVFDTYTVTARLVIAEEAAATEAVGTIAASAAIAGDAQAIWRASGTVTATAAVSGDAQAIRKTAGTIAAAATVTAAGKAIWKTAGTVTAAASVTTHGATVLKAAGTVTAAATVTATAKAIWKAIGAATGQAVISGDAQAIWKAVGTSTATAAVTATGQAVGPAATVGTVTSSASVTGDAQAIHKAAGSITATAGVTATSETAGVSAFNPEDYTTGTTFSSPSGIGPDWINADSQIVANSSWTTGSVKYLLADNINNFVLRSSTTSRDIEIDTWMRNGYVVLRYDSGTGKGIYFSHNGNSGNGYLEIGILTGGGESSYAQGTFYKLYTTTNLVGIAPGYTLTATENDYFTFGVSGFDIYVKYNGTEFIRFKEYRCIQSGSAAMKGNTGSGYRAVTVEHLSTASLFSSSPFTTLDLRDFGLKSSHTIGTISASSASLAVADASGFSIGDKIIVEIGGESGAGARGTRGVGGVWPNLSYANAAARNADSSQANGTYAWLEDTGVVYRWFSAAWTEVSATSAYYFNKAIPKALKATITNIVGSTLTLDTAATVAATSANVYFDNRDVFNKLGRRPLYDGEMNYPVETIINDLTAITPADITLSLPTGNYAVGHYISIDEHDGWILSGVSKLVTKIFSPRGAPSAHIWVTNSDSNQIKTLHLQGNARDSQFGVNWGTDGLSVTEINIPQGTQYPRGVHYQSCTNSGAVESAADCLMTDIFQMAGGAEASTGINFHRCESVMNDGLRNYIQWQFQIAGGSGGSIVDCSVTSPTVNPGFELFGQAGGQIIRPVGTNALVSFNGAETWLLEDAVLNFESNCNPASNAWLALSNPIINVNTNIGPVTLGGTIDNATMNQAGYINSTFDTFRGIVVNSGNPHIRINGGYYEAPDYNSAGSTNGAVGVDSSAADCIVDGMQVVGDASLVSDGFYANINLLFGEIKNCIADILYPPETTADVILTNNQTNDEASGFEAAVGTVNASAAVAATAKALWLAAGSSVAVSSVQAVSKVIQSAVGTSQAQATVAAEGQDAAVANIQSAVGTVQVQAAVSAEGENIGEEPEVEPPPTIPPLPPTFAGWEDTYLHNIGALGGMGPIGSGSLGGTDWQPTIAEAGGFENSYLHDIRVLGGMGPIGSGSPGGTPWEIVI